MFDNNDTNKDGYITGDEWVELRQPLARHDRFLNAAARDRGDLGLLRRRFGQQREVKGEAGDDGGDEDEGSLHGGSQRGAAGVPMTAPGAVGRPAASPGKVEDLSLHRVCRERRLVRGSIAVVPARLDVETRSPF